MSFSLDCQKSVNTCILDVHRRAGTHNDPHVSLALLDSTTFEISVLHLNVTSFAAV